MEVIIIPNQYMLLHFWSLYIGQAWWHKPVVIAT